MDGSGVLAGFEDLDDPKVFLRGEKHILKANALNFALEFDDDKAVLAPDLDTKSVEKLLQTAAKPTKTRWINLWCPERQKDTVKALAKHYGFSPRTCGLMICDPEKPAMVAMESYQTHGMRARMHRWKLDRQSIDSHAVDLEMTPTYEKLASHDAGLDLNHYRLVNEVWYYCSVDWGSKCKKPAKLQGHG